jgi:cytosol alanyl aminopeptidase
MRFLAVLLLSRAAFGADEAPSLRLGQDVRPTRYTADLTLVPTAAAFEASIAIEVTLARPASLIWLNASDLSIDEATITRSGRSQAARIESGTEGFIGLRLTAEIPAGPAAIRIRYRGKISAKDGDGVFQGKDGDQAYIYTDFEPINARRAFPCFDQPEFKTPWQLTLHIRQSDKAFSNSPQVSQMPEARGMKRVAFAATRPLPTYLVALAVGPFETVDAGTAGRNRVPVRIIVPKGKTGWAGYAAEVTAGIVQRLEDYFGIPFPYAKIDNIAVAANFGDAMENAGLVTYDQTFILTDPATDTIRRQRRYASTAAHELAHQWFGDLVTMAWWDDIWLNEAFATWMSSKTLAEWKPAWNSRVSDLVVGHAKFVAMTADSLTSGRQIRQPITSRDDIANAFDEITYAKGSAVIRMFESWMGERQFQKGVNAYLTRYAYKNARATDFLDALAGAGQPQLRRSFSTFLEQPGLPEIAVDLKCDGAARIELSQTRHLPVGSTGAQKQIWATPFCLRYPGDSGPQRECFLLDSTTAEFRLSKTRSCPAYLNANDNAAGYFVTAYGGDLLSKLRDHQDSLNAAERMTLLHDRIALADAGHAQISDALSVAASFAGAPERQISDQVQTLLVNVRKVLPADRAPNYARFVRKLFAARAEVLGWSPRAGENDDTRLLRTSLVPFVATQGEDAMLAAEAHRLADGWLSNRQGVAPDMLLAVLTTAATPGGQDLFDAMLRVLRATSEPLERQFLIDALGSFRDPRIRRQALALLLDPDLDVRETSRLLRSSPARGSEKLAFDFLQENYESLVKRLPRGAGNDYRAYLPSVGASLCDEASRQQFVAFFQDRVKDFAGGPRNYAQALEGIRVCEAQSASEGAGVAEFFSRQ